MSQPPPPNTEKAAREARLAKALRDNLRRRKAANTGQAPLAEEGSPDPDRLEDLEG